MNRIELSERLVVLSKQAEKHGSITASEELGGRVAKRVLISRILILAKELTSKKGAV